MTNTDTIAAVSTPRGTGGIAVIRISGGDAFGVVGRAFVPASLSSVQKAAHGRVYRGNIVRGGAVVDDVMASFFRAPRSYTGEDTVEISCHGGMLVTEEVLSAILAAGARPAEAGEFTRRAFTSGKLTLSEAEAVGEVIHARTRAQLALASQTSRNALEREIASAAEEITDALARVSVRIDYPEEDLANIDDGELLSVCEALFARLSRIRATARTSRAVMDGIETVICGRPNVGKSTLYNFLTGADNAIVTDIPGTTRDTLTSEATAGRVLLRISDTAGLRDTDDAVETIGVSRAREKAASAELLIAVFDASAAPNGEDNAILSSGNAASFRLAVINKTDRADAVYADEYEKIANCAGALPIRTALVSTRAASDIAAIKSAIENAFTDGKLVIGSDAIVTSARQSAELDAACASLASARDACADGMPLDIVTSELSGALAALDRLTGRSASDDVIAAVFSKFCVGK